MKCILLRWAAHLLICALLVLAARIVGAIWPDLRFIATFFAGSAWVGCVQWLARRASS